MTISKRFTPRYIAAKAGLLACAAAVAAAPALAQGVWSKPVNVSSPQPDNYSPSVAIDPTGNVTIAFLGLVQSTGTITNTYARTQAPGSPWSGLSMLSTTGRADVPITRMDASGNATVSWTSFLDTQAAERLAGGSWSPAQTVAPGVIGSQFLMNSRGDQALVWTTSAPLGLDVSVMRKPAAGAWGPVQVITSGNAQTIFIAAGTAALGDNGDLIVPFEYFRLYCPPPGGCTNVNWVLKVARQGAGGGAWEISSILAGPDNGSHYPAAAVDGAGAAGVVYRKAAMLCAVGQPGAGQPWIAPATLYAGTKPGAYGVGATGAGQATAFVPDGGRVHAISGTLATNQWTAPLVISGPDTSATRVVFSIASGGPAVAAWNGPVTAGRNPVRAAIRPTATGAWNAPQSVPGAFPGTAPESVAINSAGRAVVGIRIWLTSWSRAVLASTY